MSGLDTRAIELEELPVRPFSQVRHAFRIYISEQAFDRVTARGDGQASTEIGGILVGIVCRDDAGPYVHVDTTIDALHAEEKETELTFTHSTWEHIHREMDSRHDGKRIVGWYHTHPGFGVFLSDRDEFIHRSFFNLSHQIAFVYDPMSREHGAFAWHNDKPVRCRQYWVGGNEHTWDRTRQQEADDTTVAGPGTATMAARIGTPDSEPLSQLSWKDVLPLGFVLFLMGAGLGWWFGERESAKLLRDSDSKILAARVAGNREALQSLNLALLDSIHQMVGHETIQAPLGDGLASIERGIEHLQGGAREMALVELRDGRRQLLELESALGGAARSLSRLRAMARAEGVNPLEIRRDQSRQRSAIGQLFEEIAVDAARSGDRRRSDRLLQAAIAIDPDNAPRYERRREDLANRNENGGGSSR